MRTEELTSAILILVQEYKEHEGIDPEDINNGYCADFATVVWERLGKPQELKFEDLYGPGSGHTWLSFNNRHYDAECPNGTDDWKTLPIWQRTIPPTNQGMERIA